MIEASHQQQSSYIPPEKSDVWQEILILGIIIGICIIVYLVIGLFNETLGIGLALIVATVLGTIFTPHLKSLPSTIGNFLSSEKREQHKHNKILYQVYKIWIEDNLFKNTKSGILDNDKEIRPDAVLKQENYDEYLLPENSIGKIFHDMGGQLLILGKPGAGKTILLLQLAYYLLGEAQDDKEQAVPIVLSLSSWYPTKSFESWINNQIHKIYNIPLNTIKSYLAKNQFTFLLDGLDEVYIAYQEKCIDAINNYCIQNPNTKFAICCRIEDYGILTQKLNLKVAIELKDLTPQQIVNYISGKEYDGVRELIRRENVSPVIFTTPFLLNTLKLAYSEKAYIGSPHNQLKLNNEDEENRINHLLSNFVDTSIKQSIYPHKKLIKYLVWLTKTTSIRIEDIFYIEILSKEDLSSRFHLFYTLSYKLLSGLILGSLFSIMFIFIIDFVEFLIIFMILAILVILLASDSNLVNWYIFKVIIDKIKPKLHSLSKDTENNDIPKTLDNINQYLTNEKLWQQRDREYYFDVLSFSIPNQSIRKSFFKGIYMAAIGTIIGGVFGLIFLIPLRLTLELFYDINFEQAWLIVSALSEIIILVFGIETGLIIGLKRGWGIVINHIILRFWLHRSGNAPLNYEKFLKHCVDLGLMRQIGGGFMFRHRYLQDYFAGQYDSKQESS